MVFATVMTSWSIVDREAMSCAALRAVLGLDDGQETRRRVRRVGLSTDVDVALGNERDRCAIAVDLGEVSAGGEGGEQRANASLSVGPTPRDESADCSESVDRGSPQLNECSALQVDIGVAKPAVSRAGDIDVARAVPVRLLRELL